MVRWVLYKYNLIHTIFLTELNKQLGGSGLVIPKILINQYVPTFNIDGKPVDIRDVSPSVWKEEYFDVVEMIDKCNSLISQVKQQKLELLFKLAVLRRHPPGWGYV